MAVERVVVEVEFGIEGKDARIAGLDERIHLGERAVLGQIQREEIADQRDALPELLGGQAEAERQPPGLIIREPQGRVRPLAEDLLGRLRGDLLDLHPARLGGHHHVRRAGPVEGDRQVELSLDGRRLFDEHGAYLDALGRRLRRLEPHAEDLQRGPLGGHRIVRELDPTRFAAPTRVDLRLHNDAPAEPGRDRARLGGCRRDIPGGHRYRKLPQQRLRLVLVDFHRGYSRGGSE